MSLRDFENKKILLVGLGAEGLSTVTYLLNQPYEPAQISLADSKQESELTEAVLEVVTAHPQLDLRTGDTYLEGWEEFDIIIKSAGISPFIDPWPEIENSPNITLTSNTELFLDWAETQPQLTTIGITGTKGKSTTSSMLFHVLEQTGFNTVLGGNVGTPCLDLLPSLEKLDAETPQYAVLELSSHQTRRLAYSPSIVILQGFYPEHLDYYPTLESYYQAKADILAHQSATDLLLYRADNQPVQEIVSESLAQKHSFQLSPTKTSDCYVQDGQIVVHNTPLLETSLLPLQGDHNILNTMPSVMLAKRLKISPAKLQTAVSSFLPLEHRLEIVAANDKYLFVNDSAGTTPESCIAALDAYHDQPVILLAGGSEKGVDFTEVGVKIATGKVTDVILFPITGQKIAQAITQAKPNHSITFHETTSMPAAFKTISEIITPNHVVLLSPACASFGIFKNYKDRGNQFKDLAKEFIASAN